MNGITVILCAYVWILVPVFPNAGHPVSTHVKTVRPPSAAEPHKRIHKAPERPFVTMEA